MDLSLRVRYVVELDGKELSRVIAGLDMLAEMEKAESSPDRQRIEELESLSNQLQTRRRQKVLELTQSV